MGFFVANLCNTHPTAQRIQPDRTQPKRIGIAPASGKIPRPASEGAIQPSKGAIIAAPHASRAAPHACRAAPHASRAAPHASRAAPHVCSAAPTHSIGAERRGSP
jgi:hypothetical protein